jgi:hypothetical protein
MGEILLGTLVDHVAQSIEEVDATGPIATNARTGTSYQAGIGPHSERRTLQLVLEQLVHQHPDLYRETGREVPYGDGSRQACDLCFGFPPQWDLALEAKMLRMLGDNGKPNDNMLMHILSPYPIHRSAVTDCTKLADSRLARRTALLIFGYDYDAIDMEPAIAAFEALACRSVRLGGRETGFFDGLVHPVHRRGRVFAWELRPL